MTLILPAGVGGFKLPIPHPMDNAHPGIWPGQSTLQCMGSGSCAWQQLAPQNIIAEVAGTVPPFYNDARFIGPVTMQMVFGDNATAPHSLARGAVMGFAWPWSAALPTWPVATAEFWYEGPRDNGNHGCYKSRLDANKRNTWF